MPIDKDPRAKENQQDMASGIDGGGGRAAAGGAGALVALAPITAILLDFGGTLDGDGLHWLDRFYAIYERLEVPGLSRERIKEAFYHADARLEADPAIASCGLREMMTLHVEQQFQYLGLADGPLAQRVVEAFSSPAAAALSRNRGVLEALRRSGRRIGVVSNFYGNVRTLCDEFGLSPLCDAVLDSAVIGLRKPDPRFFRAALERVGAAPPLTVFVGDSFERDIRPARALGMRTVWLAPDRRVDCPDPSLVDARLESLSELPALFAASGVSA